MKSIRMRPLCAVVLLCACGESGTEPEPTPAVSATEISIVHDGEVRLFRLGSDSVRRLTPAGIKYCDLSWSPDGRYIAAVRCRPRGEVAWDQPASDLDIIEAATGVTVTTAQGGQAPLWSPDGKYIVVFRGILDAIDLYRITVATGDVVPLTTGRTGGVPGSWHPNGKSLLFVRNRRDGHTHFTPVIYSVGVDGAGLRQLADPGADDPEYSPDGQWIAFVDGPSLRTMRTNGSDGGILVPPRQSTWSRSRLDPTWSPDGKWIAFVEEYRGIVRIDAEGFSQQVLVSFTEPAAYDEPAWSPDGQWIAFVTTSKGVTSVSRIRADGTERTPLGTGQSFAWRPRS